MAPLTTALLPSALIPRSTRVSLAALGLFPAPDHEPGLSPPAPVEMGRFQLEASPTMPNVSAIIHMVLGWCKPRGFRDIATHGQAALTRNHADRGFKDTLL